MPDRRRIVRRPASGTVVVQDLDDQATFIQVRDSFKITPAARQPMLAKRQRRYGGARTVGETHDNGAVAFTSLVKGTSVDDCFAKAEQLLSVLESPRSDLFFEWRPEGASGSTYYEVRGPATWGLSEYNQRQMTGVKSMQLDVSIPVAPIAQKERVTQTIAAATNMGLTQIPDAIGGTAPALVDIGVTTSDGIRFMLLGWAPRVAVGPVTGQPGPFGRLAAPSPASSTGTWRFSTKNATPDAFSDELDLEIWAKISVSTGATLRAAVSVRGTDGLQVQTSRLYTEWGSGGTPLTATNNSQIYRLGSVSVPVNPDADPMWILSIFIFDATGTPSSSATVGDVLVVPTRARACSRTGVSLFDTVMFLTAGTAPLTKTIFGRDLSGQLSSAGREPVPDAGLGGSPIEMTPGFNDLMLLASNNVPNGVVNELATDPLSLTSTLDVTLTITPRVWLAGS